MTISIKKGRGQLRVAAASLLLIGGVAIGVVGAASPASAGTVVPNFMRCEPDTGWCYQTNPPYVSGIPHYCQWDYTLHNLHGGMWYTGCDLWGPDIH